MKINSIHFELKKNHEFQLKEYQFKKMFQILKLNLEFVVVKYLVKAKDKCILKSIEYILLNLAWL